MKKTTICLICLSALVGNSFGTWYQTYSSGNWSDVSKWGSGLGFPAPVPPQFEDDVYIDGDKTVDLNINSTVKSLIIGRSNRYGILNVNTAGTTLTVNTGTTIDGGGSGTMNITDGTVSACGAVTVNSSGLIDINGGTFILPSNNVILGGAGLLKLQAGAFSGGNNTSDSMYLRSNIEVSGGTFSWLSQIICGNTGSPAEFKVVGNAASITMRHIQTSYTYCDLTLKYILNSDGVSTINMTSWMFLDHTKIVVDGSAYTGGPKTIKLIDGVSINGLLDPANLTVTGLGAEGEDWTLTQNAGTGDVVLTILTAHSKPSLLILGWMGGLVNGHFSQQ